MKRKIGYLILISILFLNTSIIVIKNYSVSIRITDISNINYSDQSGEIRLKAEVWNKLFLQVRISHTSTCEFQLILEAELVNNSIDLSYGRFCGDAITTINYSPGITKIDTSLSLFTNHNFTTLPDGEYKLFYSTSNLVSRTFFALISASQGQYSIELEPTGNWGDPLSLVKENFILVFLNLGVIISVVFLFLRARKKIPV